MSLPCGQNVKTFFSEECHFRSVNQCLGPKHFEKAQWIEKVKSFTVKHIPFFPLIQQNKCIAKEKVCDIWEIFYVISIAEEFNDFSLNYDPNLWMTYVIITEPQS